MPQSSIDERKLLLHLTGLVVAIHLLDLLASRQVGLSAADPVLSAGKWAIRFLLVCLTVSPLNSYFGWRRAIPLRKPAGLWAFGFGSLHVVPYLSEAGPDLDLLVSLPHLQVGLLAFAILLALALTSNRLSMQLLRKNWKRLHRLVYVAGAAVCAHGLMAIATSKRIMLNDPQAEHEVGLYSVVCVVLLVARLPLIKRVWRALTKPAIAEAGIEIRPITAVGLGQPRWQPIPESISPLPAWTSQNTVVGVGRQAFRTVECPPADGPPAPDPTIEIGPDSLIRRFEDQASAGDERVRSRSSPSGAPGRPAG